MSFILFYNFQQQQVAKGECTIRVMIPLYSLAVVGGYNFINQIQPYSTTAREACPALGPVLSLSKAYKSRRVMTQNLAL